MIALWKEHRNQRGEVRRPGSFGTEYWLQCLPQGGSPDAFRQWPELTT